MPRILLVRPGESRCPDEVWRAVQCAPGFEVDVVRSACELEESVERRPPELTVLDCTCNGTHLDCVQCVAKWRLPFVAIVERCQWRQSHALLERALDFVLLPVHPEELIARLCVHVRAGARGEPAASAGSSQTAGILDDLIGREPAFAKVKEILPTIAETQAPVLITGETGTGKEVVARALHALGPRREAPFIPLNCGAIPGDLFESMLFGHRRGAFTGATSDHDGFFAQADGGTLLLDEIDAIPLRAQVKLLRVLQSSTFQPVGGERPQRVDVRIIAATNTDLLKQIDRKRFRSDLYYRLNIIPLRLPALRERPGDIPVLANYFLAKYGRQYGMPPRVFSSDALSTLSAARWRGNVRELENVVHRAVVMSRSSPIRGGDLQLERLSDPPRRHGRDTYRTAKAEAMSRFEQSFVVRMLHAHAGNVSQAAIAAGTDRRVFTRMVRKHHLEEELKSARRSKRG